MNKQEFIKRLDKEIDRLEGIKYISAYGTGNLQTYINIKKLALELDEPEKVVIPQFVADWIEKVRIYDDFHHDLINLVGVAYDKELKHMSAIEMYVLEEKRLYQKHY